MERDEYPVTITLDLDLLIHTEGGVRGNQQYAHENHGGRGGSHKKGRMGHTFGQQRKEGT